MRKRANLARTAIILGLMLAGAAIPACGDEAASPPPTAAVGQVVAVTTADWESTAGRLQRFRRRNDGGWQREGESIPVVIGRSGAGWGIGLHPPQSSGPRKQEGDGRSPAGIFTVGPAFGRAADLETGLTYLPLDHGHWCIDVPDSPHYNEIVHEEHVGEEAVAGSTEPMRRDIHLDDDQYRIGFVIGHNPTKVPAAGSCIFVHLCSADRSPTAGCVGVAETELQTLLAWLDEAATPRLVLLPAVEYRRLTRAWQLPPMPEPVP